MIEFLLGYPAPVFRKGQFVWLSGLPGWALFLVVAAGAAVLWWLMKKRLPEASESLSGWRPWVLWGLQSAMLAGVIAMLWRPAMVLSTLKPQQNFVAVLVDDSQSMAIADEGGPRAEAARAVLKAGMVDSLRKRFQTRLYRISDGAERIGNADILSAAKPATRLADSIKQVMADSSGLPLGAVILMTDGADNSGGIDRDTITQLRGKRIPVHTMGFGKAEPPKDLEIADVQVPTRTLADSRVAARVSFRNHGLEGRQVKITVRDDTKVLAARQVKLGPDGNLQSESVLFNAGEAGARSLRVSMEKIDGEVNSKNNETVRMLNVDGARPRILYFEGEPRWEYKFLRRAVEDDRSLQVTSLLRTTQNKFYRQGIENPKELEDGFPTVAADLFKFDGLILGSVEWSYFTPTQQELIKQFVDLRGGGLLLLGGRGSLSEGGYARSPLAELLPVTLPDRKGTFLRDPANVELAPAGLDSLICRLVEDPVKNAERWKKLPYLADYQDIGTPKPGSAVLASYNPGQRGAKPLLVTQNYGRGRTAVLATGGTWRWQMQQELEDQTHEVFWRQLLRWLVTDSPGRVRATASTQTLLDEGLLKVTAEVRDKDYRPVADARVEANILGPEGLAAKVEMSPDATAPGTYRMEWTAVRPGPYVTEILARRGGEAKPEARRDPRPEGKDPAAEDLARDVFTFQRQNGIAENFRTQKNVELLEGLAAETGGRYWDPDDWKEMVEEAAVSEAGVTVREPRELWNMPVIFLVLILMKAAEWLLRRKWGIV